MLLTPQKYDVLWVRPDYRSNAEVALLADVRFTGEAGVEQRVAFTDTYSTQDGVQALRAFLFSLHLFVTDWKQLLSERRLEESLKAYLDFGPVVEAVARLRYPGPLGSPYRLTQHRSVKGQPFRRDKIALVPVAEAREREREWLQAAKKSKDS